MAGTPLASLVLSPSCVVDPDVFDIEPYNDFLDALCPGRQYQSEAIKASVSFLLSGRYASIDALLDEVWADPVAYGDLHTHYGNREFHQGLLTFPGRLAATVDLATATGKSYLLYGVARIALNEGVDVRRVLVLVPSKVIREELRDKFAALLSNANLNATLPDRPKGVKSPTLVDATATVEDGSICIENRDQVYAAVRSSIRPSFADGTGKDTLVLNDEAHHVYDETDDAKKAASEWFKFLNDPEYGFRRILGVSGTCFTPNDAPYDYFADVLYRYSVKQAINAGHAKQVRSVDSITGSALVATHDLYQEAIWKVHQKNKAKYGQHIKPLTIVVCQSIESAKRAKVRFVEYVQKTKQSDANIADKCLVVSSSVEDASDRQALRDIEKPGSPHEYVFSVSMLTEGWDAKGVFQVVPYEQRAFNSHLLIAQVLGRGLRVPAVPGLPTPVCRVLNHTAWASSVEQIVSDIIDGEADVPVRPYATANGRHFTIDYLARSVTVAKEQQIVDLDDALPPDELFTTGVPLRPQRPNDQARIGWKDAATGKTEDEDTISTFTIASVDEVVAEQYRMLRDESLPGSPRRRDVEAAGKSAVKSFIHASMRRSNIPASAATVVSAENIERIRAGLLRCFPVANNKQAPLFTEVLTEVVKVELAEPLSTADIKARSHSSAYLLDQARHTYYSSTSIADFSGPELRAFSALASASANFTQLQDWELRSPMTTVVVSHKPEANFIRALTHKDNRRCVTCWVKSPDQGFYAIPYTRSGGDKSGQTLNFNPDFILWHERDGRDHIYLVETKVEKDVRDKNRDKVKAADQYVVDLNAVVGDDRPTYSFHMLAPSDFLPFFDALRRGEGESYTGVLHQTLKADKAPEETSETTVLNLSEDAWEDD